MTRQDREEESNFAEGTEVTPSGDTVDKSEVETDERETFGGLSS